MRSEDTKTDRRGRMLEEWFDDWSLYILHTSEGITFQNKRGSSTPDVVIVNETALNLVDSSGMLPDQNLSDHKWPTAEVSNAAGHVCRKRIQITRYNGNNLGKLSYKINRALVAFREQLMGTSSRDDLITIARKFQQMVSKAVTRIQTNSFPKSPLVDGRFRSEEERSQLAKASHAAAEGGWDERNY